MKKIILIFGLVLIVSCNQFPLRTNQEYDELRNKLGTEIGRLHSKLNARDIEVQTRNKELKQIKKLLEKEIENKEICIATRNNKIIINVMNKILFDTGKIYLKSEALKSLDKILLIIQDFYFDKIIEIEGNTDIVPIHNKRFPSNWELSTSRAHAVRLYLLSQGINPSQIIIVGRGKYNPIDTNKTKEGKANNRRVDIIINP